MIGTLALIGLVLIVVGAILLDDQEYDENDFDDFDDW